MNENSIARQNLKKTAKRRRDRHALRHVISMRISDDELQLLRSLKKKTAKSASEIMRDAFVRMQQPVLMDCI